MKAASQYSISDITWARGLASRSVLLALPLRDHTEFEPGPRELVVFVHVPGADNAASSIDPCRVVGDVTIKCSLRQSCDGVALDEQRGILKD